MVVFLLIPILTTSSLYTVVTKPYKLTAIQGISKNTIFSLNLWLNLIDCGVYILFRSFIHCPYMHDKKYLLHEYWKIKKTCQWTQQHSLKIKLIHAFLGIIVWITFYQLHLWHLVVCLGLWQIVRQAASVCTVEERRKEHARGGGARGACFCVIVGIARPFVTISAPNVLHSSAEGRVGPWLN